MAAPKQDTKDRQIAYWKGRANKLKKQLETERITAKQKIANEREDAVLGMIWDSLERRGDGRVVRIGNCHEK